MDKTANPMNMMGAPSPAFANTMAGQAPTPPMSPPVGPGMPYPMGQGMPMENRSFMPSDNKEGEQQSQFEMAFKDMAYDTFSAKFPELVPGVVTFKIIESDVDKGLAVGAFIVEYRIENIYIPVVLFEDNVKPMEIMYSKRLDKFLPLKQEWLDLLISSNDNALGESVAVPQNLASDVDIRNLVAPPITGRFGYASDKNVTFIDYLDQSTYETKLAFAKLLKENKNLLKFAYEKFDKERLTNALLDKNAAEVPDAQKPGMTEVVVVDNETPSETVKEVFKDKAPDAMKMIAREGFAFKDNRDNVATPYAVDSQIKFERPKSCGVYRIYKADGGIENAYIIPKVLKPNLDGGPYIAEPCSGRGFGEDYDNRANWEGMVILENGDYYDHFGVTTPLVPSVLKGKLADVVFKGKSDSPKVGDRILFVKTNESGLKKCGPFKVDEIITEKDGTKKFLERCEYDKKKIVKTIIYKDTVTKKVMEPKGSYDNEVKMIPKDYNLLVLGKKLNERELLRNEKEALQYIQDALVERGGVKVKVSAAGGGEYSIFGKTAENKKDTILRISNEYNVAPDAILEKLNSLNVPGDKLEFYVVSDKEKIASILQGTTNASQILPHHVAGQGAEEGTPQAMPPQMMSPEMMGMVPPQSPEMQEMPSELMTDAAALNNPELFDIGAIASLAGTVSVRDLVSVYIPHLEKALDSLGRIILTFWMQGEHVKTELGTATHQVIEDKLRNIFNNLGELILKLGKNTLLLQEGKK
jgi:hypothetical protein